MYTHNHDMPTPARPPRPPFIHPTTAIQSFIDYILDTPTLEHRPQFIMLAGIFLNNIPLIEYSASVEPDVVNTPIPSYVETIVKQIINPEGEYPPPMFETAAPNPA